MTVTIRSRAKAKFMCMTASQTNRVMAPPPRATMVNQSAALFARSWVLDLLSWACLTSSMTWERKESLPVFLTSTVMEPSPLIDPPVTLPPASFVHRFRLPGQHGLVHGCLSFHHVPVHGDLLARLYEDPVARLEFIQGYVPGALVGHDFVGSGGHRASPAPQGLSMHP